jgi:hypothetical protein
MPLGSSIGVGPKDAGRFRAGLSSTDRRFDFGALPWLCHTYYCPRQCVKKQQLEPLEKHCKGCLDLQGEAGIELVLMMLRHR